MGQRQSFSDTAPLTTLTAPCGPTDTTISVASTAGYPNTSAGPFDFTFDRNTGTEERGRCTATTPTTMTVVRGIGGTTAQEHASGSGTIEHSLSGAFMEDISAQIYEVSEGDIYYASAAGTPAKLAIGSTGEVLTVGSSVPAWANLIDLVYPVGSVFVGAVSTNPATLLGVGTWAAIGQGRVLMGVGTGTDIHSNTLAVTEGAGGDSIGEYKHTLTGAESGTSVHGHNVTDPTHVHGSLSNNGGFLSDGLNGSGTGYTGAAAGTGADWSQPSTGAAATGVTVNSSAAANAANAHNLVEPYFGVYVWARTA